MGLHRRISILLTALTLPVAALADLGQATTLSSNTLLSLDDGTTSVSGPTRAVGSPADILWNGSTITPQGTAKAYNLGLLGATVDSFDANYFQTFRILASATAIPASALGVNDVFVVFTNGGHTSKVLVTANTGGSITLKFVTYIAAVATGPTVTAVLNNSSRIPSAFPSYGIAPSSLFIIQGSGLSDPGDPVLQSSEGAGLQTSLNGTSITVTFGNTTAHPALYYTSPAQLAAVLPASTPLGNGTLTVTYRGATSAGVTIRVVASALGFNTYNGSGVATDATTGGLLTYANSGTPGQTIILWTTGLGANPADSDTVYTTTPHSINVSLQVYIGGVQAPIVYQGASVYPGVDVIGLVIPQSVPNGCWISVAAVVGGSLNHVVTLPINKGGGACLDWQSGLTGNLFTPASGQTLKTGLVALIQTHTTSTKTGPAVNNSTDAAFEKYSGLYAPSNAVSPGGCIVNYLTPVPIPGITGMDPGTITLSGPAGLNVTLAPQFGIKGAFYASLADGAIPTTGGAFVFKGSGGADVGSFSTTINFSNPLLTWTNQSAAASIDRTKGLLVTWNGGNPGTYVIITGATIPSTTPIVEVSYTCLASVDAGQFTVPSYILSALPPGNGSTLVQHQVYSNLSPSGLDIGVALGAVSYSQASVYQGPPSPSK